MPQDNIIPVSAGEDIRLSLFESADADYLYHQINRHRSHLAGWLGSVGPLSTKHEVLRFIRANEQAYRTYFEGSSGAQPGFQFAIRSGEDIAGMIGFQGINRKNRLAALGYWVFPEYEGRGLVTRTCRTLTSYAFEVLGMNRIEIQCAEDNPRSMGIPERLGFVHEAVLAEVERRGEAYVSHHLYRMLRSDWQSQ